MFMVNGYTVFIVIYEGFIRLLLGQLIVLYLEGITWHCHWLARASVAGDLSLRLQ